MANPTHIGPFTKSAQAGSFDASVRKFVRRQARQAEKDRLDRLQREADSIIRKACFVRDGGRCRAYGVPVKLVTDNPLELAECHHIEYRSAGGSDEPFNRATLSPQAHRDEHDHKLVISGDGNGTLTFVKRDVETGRVLQMWTSDPQVTR